MTPLPVLPESCPKFQTCDAAVCPLDPRWPEAAHLNGEPVCRYLLATGKAGATEHYASDPIFASVRAVAPAVLSAHPPIAHAVRRAASKGIRRGQPVEVLRRGKAVAEGALGMGATREPD